MIYCRNDIKSIKRMKHMKVNVAKCFLKIGPHGVNTTSKNLLPIKKIIACRVI